MITHQHTKGRRKGTEKRKHSLRPSLSKATTTTTTTVAALITTKRGGLQKSAPGIITYIQRSESDVINLDDVTGHPRIFNQSKHPFNEGDQPADSPPPPHPTPPWSRTTAINSSFVGINMCHVLIFLNSVLQLTTLSGNIMTVSTLILISNGYYVRGQHGTRIPIQTKPKISVLFNKYIFPLETNGHSKKAGDPVPNTALLKLSMVSGRKKLEPQFPPPPPPPRGAFAISALHRPGCDRKQNKPCKTSRVGRYLYSISRGTKRLLPCFHIRHPFAPPTLVYYVLGVEIPAIPTIKENLPKGVSNRVFILSGGTGC